MINEVLFKNNLVHYFIICLFIFLYSIFVFKNSKVLIILSSISFSVTLIMLLINIYLKYIFRNDNIVIISLYTALISNYFSYSYINHLNTGDSIKIAIYTISIILLFKIIILSIRIFKIKNENTQTYGFLNNEFKIFNNNNNYLNKFYCHKIDSIVDDNKIFFKGNQISLSSFEAYLKKEKIDQKSLTKEDIEIYQMQII